jgi:hypothetical protein
MLLQVALRRVLQAMEPGMSDAEASNFIKCSRIENGTDW